MLFSRNYAENTLGGVAVAGVRTRLQVLAILPLALLVSCVPLQPTQQPHPAVSASSTALFSVTLNGAAALERDPMGLIINVEAQHGSTIKQFAFTPNTRIRGHHTTFLVRMDLPTGRYSLTHFTAIAPDGAPIPEFDVAPNIAFNLRHKVTDYLGHVELSNIRATDSTPETAPLVIADAYEDEVPNFVHAWPALRGRRIGDHALTAVTQ